VSDEQFSSKRERQKARRAERLKREASEAQAANRRQKGVYGLITLVVLALVGALVFQQFNKRNQQNEQVAAAAAKLDELGCTTDTQMPDLGGGHIGGTAEALAAEAPDVIYTGDPGQPPSSGRHFGQVVPSGVFDVPIDPRLTTHNLEHGYLVVWYSPDAPEEQVEALKSWGQERLGGDFPKTIVAEYYEPLPEGRTVAFTAWFQRQMCEQFDTDIADVFTRANYDISGEAPEKGIPSHTVGAQGVLDPQDEPLFLPPLSEEFGTNSPLDEGTVPEAPQEGETEGEDAATEPAG
jgi:hypothetical protein